MTADRELAGVLAELLRPALVEAVAAEVRAVLEGQIKPPPEPLLSVGEAAGLANCHAETIRRAIAAGRLPAVTSLGRHPRIRRSDLDAFLEPERAEEGKGRRA